MKTGSIINVLSVSWKMRPNLWFLWLIMIDNNWWLFWAHLIGLALYTHYTPQTPWLIWTIQESHVEPFQTSNSSHDQLCRQLFFYIKCMAQLCRCHDQYENCCRVKTGQDRVNLKPPKTSLHCLEAAERRVTVSTVKRFFHQHGPRGCRAR